MEKVKLIDFRYHIYSLAAVFLALAIGIVIGTSFAKSMPATASERSTILRYENSMRVLKREIELASDEAAAKESVANNCEDFCRALLPMSVKSKLEFKNIAIVQTGDYDELSGSVKNALELAGAAVSSVTDISRDFKFDDPSRVAEVLTACGHAVPHNNKEARDKLLNIIAQTLSSAAYPDLMSKLEDQGVGTFRGEYGKYNRLIVLVGGCESEDRNTAPNVDAQLVELLRKQGSVVVGCEGTESKVSYVPAWSKAGIATIDNADTSMGQVALVFALNGEKSNFGVKETAARLVPQGLEPK